MHINDFGDADIIDYPQPPEVFGGYGMIDTEGRGYLAVQFDRPDRRPRGRPLLTETQRILNDTMCSWGLRAFHTARELGHSSDSAQAMVAENSRIVSGEMAASVLTNGRRSCQETFGMDVRKMQLTVQRKVRAANEQGADAANTLLRAELGTFANLGRAYSRSLSYEGGLYEAFHGRLPGSFYDKLGDAFNPRPNEEHFSLPIAAQLTLLTGVNMAFLWQEQWFYGSIFDTIAALHDWTRFKPATLAPEELYTLFRCIQSASPADLFEHGLVKNFISLQIDCFYRDRLTFLRMLEVELLDVGLLPDPPQTYIELLRRSRSIIEPSGEQRSFIIAPPEI